MKIKIISILFISSVLFCIAQDVLLLPFDATSLTEEQKTLNPNYRAYPTALEDSMPTIICNDDLSDCIEAVDLGLSVKWATCNVGASSPEEYGDYFAWGETEPKEVYDWSTYKWCEGTSTTLTKYNTISSDGTVDNKTVLEPEDDAATANWGGAWRMPTDAEMTELREQCTWTWTTLNGVDGYKVTSKSNGNSIFFPAAGRRYISSDTPIRYHGYYWSSSLRYIDDHNDHAWNLVFTSGQVLRGVHSRSYGLVVRPVINTQRIAKVETKSL